MCAGVRLTACNRFGLNLGSTHQSAPFPAIYRSKSNNKIISINYIKKLFCEQKEYKKMQKKKMKKKKGFHTPKDEKKRISIKFINIFSSLFRLLFS